MFKLYLSLILLVFVSVAAQAQSTKHMISGNSLSQLSINDSNSGTGVEASFSLGLSYNYSLDHGFQVGSDLGLTITDLTNFYTILPGVTYNIFTDEQESLSSAYFIKVNAGIIIVDFESLIITSSGSNSFSSSTTEFLYTLEFGKRFEIVEHVSWSPSLEMTHVPGAIDSDPTVDINIFKMDVTF